MEIKIKNRHKLKNKDVRNIVKKLEEDFEITLNIRDSTIESGIYESTEFLFVNGKPYFMFYNNKLVLTLKGLNHFQPKNKCVVVDMGAVKYVTNGADVMSPGIVNADAGIKTGDTVWICDEKNKKPLAIGTAIITGEEMITFGKGKAIAVFHYIGDRLWNFINRLTF
jgi:PUA domain protein